MYYSDMVGDGENVDAGYMCIDRSSSTGCSNGGWIASIKLMTDDRRDCGRYCTIIGTGVNKPPGSVNQACVRVVYADGKHRPGRSPRR